MVLKKHLLPYLLFLLLLGTGLAVYKDYGLAWDEPAQRGIGNMNYFFLEGKDKGTLPQSLDRYHGPAFEMLLITVERKLHITDPKDLYEMRHLLNFLLFFSSCVCFYFLCYNRYRSQWIAIAGFLFLVFSPRIFADAFYNSKDLPTLCFFIFGFYTLERFLNKPGIRNSIIHGMVCGILMDIRMIGIILPLLSIFFLLLRVGFQTENFKKLLTPLILSLIGFSITAYALWPILWHNPFKELILAFQQLSHYPWIGACLYHGSMLSSDQLPWTYIPVWILISTPPFYIFLFFTGSVFLIATCINSYKTFLITHANECVYMICLVAPLTLLILMHSIVYDAWRHFFFVYPSILMIGVFGLHSLNELTKNGFQKNSIKFIPMIMTIAGLASPVYATLRLHPYENVYFNSWAGNTLKDAAQNYETDYWGISYKEGLQYILSHDSSDYISVYAMHAPGELNALMLERKERKRLEYVSDYRIADYVIATYRGHPQPYTFGEEIYSVMRGGARLLTVQKVKNRLHDKFEVNKTVYYNSFETSPPGWSQNCTDHKQTDAPSPPMVNVMYSNCIFGATLSIHDLPVIKKDNDIYLKCSLFYKQVEENADLELAISLEDKEHHTYFWRKCNISDLEENLSGRWLTYNHSERISQIREASDIITLYVFTNNKRQCMVDNFKVEVFELGDQK